MIRPKLGAITLQTYVAILKEASINPLPNLDKVRENREKYRAMKELLDAGLLSDAATSIGGSVTFVSDIILTPDGAHALVEWSEYLQQLTFWSKFGKVLVQALWILVGALAAAIPETVRRLL